EPRGEGHLQHRVRRDPAGPPGERDGGVGARLHHATGEVPGRAQRGRRSRIGTREEGDVSDAPVPAWFMNGSLVGSCNCEWGCPCNFDAPPTYGFCDGFYALAIREGRFGDVPRDGLAFVFGGHAPGPPHGGGGTEVR